MFSGHETAEVRDGVVQDHRARSGRFEIVTGRTAQTAAGRGGHLVDHHGQGRQERAKWCDEPTASGRDSEKSD